MELKPKKIFAGLTKDTILLAFTSFFADVSTEMLYPILPVYLTQYLHANGSIIGLIEGIAQATQNVAQGFSGYLSDKFQRHKIIALGGYLLAAISKPLMGFATSWQLVLAARFSDRLGAGSRSAPRDALVAASVEERFKGKAFGLEGIGDNLGAFLGPLITVVLFLILHFDIHSIFFLAFIPGLLAFILMLFVKEKKKSNASTPRLSMSIGQFPASYWKYLFVVGIFNIGNSSNAFLILQVKDRGLSMLQTVLVYAMYNLVAALASYPSGSLSDKFGRKPLMLSAFIVFLAAYSGFAFSSDLVFIAFLFAFYGMFQGIFRSVGKSFASDFVPSHLRGSSIGWYSSVVGISGLIASLVGGQLWDHVSHASVFVYGACSAVAGIFLLLILIPNNRRHTNNPVIN